MQTRRCPPSVESRFCQRLKFRPSLRLSISTSQTPVCLPSPSRTTVALDTTVSDTISLIDEDSKVTSYKMLQLNLARETRPMFDTSYSPDQSECSSSSRSPSPPRRSPSPHHVPRSNTMSSGRNTLPRSQTHPTDLSASAAVFRRPSRNGNEEVLRSRLEGVLSSSSTSRDASCPPSPHRRRATTSGDISTTFGLMTPPHGPFPPVPTMTRSRTSPAMSRSSPITPPPSPPFDAKRIALQLRDREGYVSFADVQGLGIPNEELDTVDDRSRAKWWSLWKG
ncbi:hypothetical protein RSOLAG1IB_04251 [Rhizoctonia solani AG-1 IB]|uniref:Uncharacterized protein n=1 Tax=Thanatephorus cucumeris (strain AG1-IB / isolate 7/3/14) TaxID=1108050 RepID=A0A0B7FXU3_THACB|nr:hypothetical protein RSOLAG1IB_04251 [Rhizoctonia solani AG-1 IB]